MRDALWAISLVAAALIAALFLRHWRRTGDRFFALFSAAFVALAITNALQIIVGAGETKWSVYPVRLAGFVLVIVAIVDKNRPRAQAIPTDDMWSLEDLEASDQAIGERFGG